MKLLKPMLPSLAAEIPKGEDWVYEVKYDGFRAMIYLDGNRNINIVSRNQNLLNEQFPEIFNLFEMVSQKLGLPLILDGELAVLEGKYKANFDLIQKRGRLKNNEKIQQAVKSTPVTFMAFDLLMENGVSLLDRAYLDRKKQLEKVIATIDHPHVKFVSFFEDSETLWDSVSSVQGEGVIAKRTQSTWQEGQRTKHWLKIKNMIIATFFVLAYDETNAFFHIGCLYKGEIKMIGKVGQGFTKEEKEALVATIKKNQVKTVQSLTYVKPGICIEVEFLEFSRNELRHPKFRRFRLDKNWEDCTWEAIPKLEQN